MQWKLDRYDYINCDKISFKFLPAFEMKTVKNKLKKNKRKTQLNKGKKVTDYTQRCYIPTYVLRVTVEQQIVTPQ
jgi:hypothetical protein